MPKNKNVNVKKLTMSAVMVALSAALSLVKIFEMPLGGSVTLLSMLPVCMLAIMYGCKWGLFCSFVYALSQLLLGIGAVLGWGLTPAALAGCIAFDYIIAFTVLGFAGFQKARSSRLHLRYLSCSRNAPGKPRYKRRYLFRKLGSRGLESVHLLGKLQRAVHASGNGVHHHRRSVPPQGTAYRKAVQGGEPLKTLRKRNLIHTENPAEPLVGGIFLFVEKYLHLGSL